MGTDEAADAVFAASEHKRVVGLINPLAASAAYGIGAQCSELVAIESADVGSIGVFMTDCDMSKFNEQIDIQTPPAGR